MLMEDDDTAELAMRALVRIGPKLAARAIAHAENAPPRVRARLVRVVGKLDVPESLPFLLRSATDEDPKTRRNALGELRRVQEKEQAEDALLAAWQKETNVPLLRTIAMSLGKIGSPRALEALRTRAPGADADAELTKAVSRATQTIARDAGRREESGIDASAAASTELPVLFFCRPGLQLFLAEELGSAWRASVARPGEVRATLRGPLSSIFTSRMMTHVGFELAPEEGTEGVAEAVARALSGAVAREIFAKFTRGRVRYRIAWAEGGHKRSLVWKIAELVQARAPEIVNDPRESTWEAVVRTTTATRAEVVLVPRALGDPRFAYRVAEVPAASHPTIAAALAHVGGVKADDVVWDPFVGSALELIERGRKGPFARLLGTDLDAGALDAARRNLAAARIEARLEQGDSLRANPRGVTLILTNPPMGRRVQRQGELVPFLERFVAHAAHILVPGGRLAWVSPRGALTRDRALKAGLVLDRAQSILMGGFEAEIQLFRAKRR